MPEETTYRVINKHQRRDAVNFLQDFHKLLPWSSGESFVDIGCGPGDVTRDIIWPLLPRDLTRLVCLDISRDHLDRCREEFCDDDHVSCVVIDMRKRQDFHNLGQFDHATSLMCFHWIPEQKTALANVHDLLKIGGSFFFTFVAECPNRKINEEIIKSKKWAKFFHNVDTACEPYWNSPDPIAIFRNLLSEGGFADITVELREVIYEWEGREDFLNYIITFSALLIERIPQDLRAEFLEDNVELGKSLGVIKSQREPHTPIDPYKIIVGCARKC